VYGIADYVFTILAFLEKIQWFDGEQFDLIGHSMGASMSLFS
jgi:pimeloyl-ACP methyl ester carboxylesterase